MLDADSFSSILTFYHLVSIRCRRVSRAELKGAPGLAAVLFGPSFDFAQDVYGSVLPIRRLGFWQDGIRASVTPRCGVWRKFL
jgi:hypothetical protein